MKKIFNKALTSLLVLSLVLPIIPIYKLDLVKADTSFVDDYVNLSLLDSSSTLSNLAIATSDQSAKHGITDMNRVYKKSHVESLDTETYLVYHFTEEIKSFTVDSIYMKKEINGVTKIPGDLVFEISVDGTTYTPFKSVSRTVEREDTWVKELFRGITFASTGALPTDARYIRITFGGTQATASNTTLQILKTQVMLGSPPPNYTDAFQSAIMNAEQSLSSVVVGTEHGMCPQAAYTAFSNAITAAKAVFNDTNSTQNDFLNAMNALNAASIVFSNSIIVIADSRLIDECNNYSMIWGYDSNIGIVSSNPDKMDNDSGRFFKTSGLSGGYLIYKASEKEMFTDFTVDAWYNKKNNNIAMDMTFEVSNDNVTYTTIPTEKVVINGTDWPNDLWRLCRYTGSGLPQGTKYLKINYGDTSFTSVSWSIQVGKVEIGIKKDYKMLLTDILDEAGRILANTVIGTHSGMCTQTSHDKLLVEKNIAQSSLSETNITKLETAYKRLLSEVEVFKARIIHLVNWPTGAELTYSGLTSKGLKLSWSAAQGEGVIYYIYKDGVKVAETTATTYDVTSLAAQTQYSLEIIANIGQEFSEVLGPIAVKTNKLESVSPPDFSKIKLEDFNDNDFVAPLVWPNDKRGIPYYFYHLHEVLNAVKMDGEYKGFVDAFISRDAKAFKTNNIRIQEAFLPITYFYARNEPWNIYYGKPEVKIRLEAVIEYALKLQKANGAFPQNTDATYDLAGTTFFLNFMGQAIKLLKEEEKRNPDFPSIDPALMERVRAASEKAIRLTLSNTAWWNYGTEYSNQYGLIWSATAAYLEYYPNAEIEQMLKDKYAQSDAFISPAGFYYEEKGCDINYNLGVHANNIAAEYSYFKGTELEDQLIREQTKFFDWLSYNLVIEPDGSWFTPNGEAGKRISSTNLLVYRKDFPIAEKIEIARAFVRSDEDIEDEVAAAKNAITSNGAWPVIPNMQLNGGSTYNAYGIFDRLLYQYRPTQQERQAAIDKLPYMANERFTQVRGDTRANVQFSFIKRPSYYTIFNAGGTANPMQVYGLGLLWHPEGGIMLASQSEKDDKLDSNDNPLANDFSWGTKLYYEGKNQKLYRVYENAPLLPKSYKINGEKVSMPNGILDLPDGDFEIEYKLGANVGNKIVAYKEDGMEVKINHPGKFQECFPLMVRPEDKFEVQADKFTLVRGRAVMEIIFNKPIEPVIEKKMFNMSRYTMNMLSAITTDDLTYKIKLSIREPELSEDSSNIQVSIDDINGNGSQSATQPVPTTESEVIQQQETQEYIFKDISNHWAKNDIEYLASKGYIQGIGDNTFNPDGSITRAEFISLIINAFGITLDSSSVSEFTDVPKDSWYHYAVITAKQKGIVRGIDDKIFAPNDVIESQEMELISLRAYQYVVNKGNIQQNVLATRAQAAVVLRRLLDGIEEYRN